MAYFRALLIAACLAAVFSLAHSQYFGFLGAPRQAHVLGGGANTRDPRGNTGPVLFPPSAPGTETSGVVVGASGFGFVPGTPRAAAQSPFGRYNIW